jgi:hypothetical protein
MRKPHLIGNSASALVPDEQASARSGARAHNPNARAQGKTTKPVTNSVNTKKGYSAGNQVTKPAAKAFGDKFESAKQFNAQTPPATKNAPMKKHAIDAKASKIAPTTHRSGGKRANPKPGTKK